MMVLIVWAMFTGPTPVGALPLSYYLMIMISGGGIIFFVRAILHEVFEAQYGVVEGNVFKVGYLHFGEREYKLTSTLLRKTMITRTWSNVSGRMWRVRFGGWRLATLPTDWENPLEPENTSVSQ